MSAERRPPHREHIKRAPKVLLHDHLDGGLRPETIVELADALGYQGLPELDAGRLGRWFREAADSGSLERYLETFEHTVGVMQTTDALFRVAAECAVDLAADGVVYAEIRYAPEQHLSRGLQLRTSSKPSTPAFARASAAPPKRDTVFACGRC
jgi:adenosine deaminase